MSRTNVDGVRLRRLDLAAAAADHVLAAERDRLCRRGAVPDPEVRAGARAILAELRADPEIGLREASARHGGGLADGRLVLEPTELRAARDDLGAPIRAALEQAIENVRRFAESQLPATTVTTEKRFGKT